jgi:hypothetical protein
MTMRRFPGMVVKSNRGLLLEQECVHVTLRSLHSSPPTFKDVTDGSGVFPRSRGSMRAFLEKPDALSIDTGTAWPSIFCLSYC